MQDWVAQQNDGMGSSLNDDSYRMVRPSSLLLLQARIKEREKEDSAFESRPSKLPVFQEMKNTSQAIPRVSPKETRKIKKLESVEKVIFTADSNLNEKYENVATVSVERVEKRVFLVVKDVGQGLEFCRREVNPGSQSREVYSLAVAECCELAIWLAEKVRFGALGLREVVGVKVEALKSGQRAEWMLRRGVK